jgi:hypothetical protein
MNSIRPWTRPACPALLSLFLALFLALGCLTLPSGARADGDNNGPPVKPAPRTAIEIGGVSVVLVSANDKLHVFIDRLANNAPADDAGVSIMLADGTDLQLSRAAGGFFVGPFNRAGRMRDAFMVSVKSASGTGEMGAEIAYDDLPDDAVAAPSHDIKGKIGIALVAAALGAAGATMVLRWARNRRQGAAGHHAPAA